MAHMFCCAHASYNQLPLLELDSFNSTTALSTAADDDHCNGELHRQVLSYVVRTPLMICYYSFSCFPFKVRSHSPTLYCTTTYISGVAISRTPEPGAHPNQGVSDGSIKSGRGNRSSSLTTTALPGILQTHPLERGLSKSAGRLSVNNHVVKDGSCRPKKRRHDIRRLTMPAVLCSGTVLA